MNIRAQWLRWGLAGALAAGTPLSAQAPSPTVSPVAIPGGSGGIGFDDLRYSRQLHRVLVPAGRTGSLALIDPGTLSTSVIEGFSKSAAYAGGHGEGTTSVDEGGGFLVATDRTAGEVAVVDPGSKSIVARAKLTGGPDYVRFVSATSEVWVTEPQRERIEVFRFEKGNPPRLTAPAAFPVPGGPESLVIDDANGRAYTHAWKGSTMAIDLRSRRVVSTWKNGCAGSRGIALDSARGFLFAGCAEGKAVVLDASSGRPLSSLISGSGIDIIDFDPQLSHLYFPGGRSATMAILGVSGHGQLSLLGTVPTEPGAHCVTTDLSGTAYVCDPKNGRILAIRDPYPPTH